MAPRSSSSALPHASPGEVGDAHDPILLHGRAGRSHGGYP